MLGNLLRLGSSKLAPGFLGTGANRIEYGQTLTNKQLSNGKNVFAGQPATMTNGTISMNQPLNEVIVTPFSKAGDIIGDVLKPIVSKATEGMNVGADNKTLLIISGGFVAVACALIYAIKK